MKYKILIVDDEDSGRQALRILIDKVFWAYTTSVEFCNSFQNAKDRIQASAYDIIFLDINLKGISAFDLLTFIPESSKVVFVTAYSEFMLQALRNKAFDYLVKPVKEEELKNCVERIIQEAGRQDPGNTIQVKSNGITRVFNFSDILYIEGDGPYSIFHLRNEQVKTARTIKSILPLLETQFIRIHKSFLVNRKHIKGFNAERVILHNDEHLPVSRTGYKGLSV